MANTPTTGHLDLTVTGQLIREANSGWICVAIPDSGTILGTRKPVKIIGTIDGHPLHATLLPMGDGNHMVPIKAALRKLLDTDTLGTEVTVHFTERLT